MDGLDAWSWKRNDKALHRCLVMPVLKTGHATLFVIVLLFVVFLPMSLPAAEVKVERVEVAKDYGKSCLEARITFSGAIVEGDSTKLADAIAVVDGQALKAGSTCFLNDASSDRLIYVEMDSPGGLYIEGWKIAKLLSNYDSLAGTYVADGKSCYSACAIAFLGGSVPGADGAIIRRRIIHPNAKLGFHAPFPVLKDQAYSADVVREFFLAAFTVATEFSKNAKMLGITPEVAQMLLQPTPDRFFDINTVGRALLANVTVSAARYTFNVYTNGVKNLSRANLQNLCYNNQIIRRSGEFDDLVGFLRYRDKSPPLIMIETKARYFEASDQPSTAVVVPVADAGEGDIESCVALVAASSGQHRIPKGRLNYTCLGFAFGESDLADKIRKGGIAAVSFGEKETCAADSKIALLPWGTTLDQIPPDFMGD